MSYRAGNGTRQWDGSKKVPEERMAVKMQSFARTGITPDIAGADLSYSLKLQYDRWKEKGLESTIEIVPYGEGKPQIPTAGNWWADEKYSHERRVELGKKTQKYFKDGACIYTNESVATIYAVVSNTTAENEVVANDFYCCPSCGASCRIRELMTGCPYCRTKFQMPDLFPKVTNFYFFEDHPSQPGFLQTAVIVGAVIAFLYEAVNGIIRQDISALFSTLIAIPLGAFAGLLCGALPYLGYIINKSVQGVGEISGSKKAERKIRKKVIAVDSSVAPLSA